MTKQCKCVLQNLKKLTNNSDCFLSFLGNSTCICRMDDYNATYDYCAYQTEINSIINFLASTGYLIFLNESKNQFMLSHKGIHPYRVSWESAKQFLINSFLTPIAVAFITTLITLALKGTL